jgi:hypothetical protein
VGIAGKKVEFGELDGCGLEWGHRIIHLHSLSSLCLRQFQGRTENLCDNLQ